MKRTYILHGLFVEAMKRTYILHGSYVEAMKRTYSIIHREPRNILGISNRKFCYYKRSGTFHARRAGGVTRRVRKSSICLEPGFPAKNLHFTWFSLGRLCLNTYKNIFTSTASLMCSKGFKIIRIKTFT